MRSSRNIVAILAVAAIAVAGAVAADGPPKKLVIKKLVNLYGPADFDHEMHVSAADGCKSCHHKPFGKPMACSECHEEKMDRGDFDHEAHWEFDSCDSCHQVKSTRELACSTCHKVPFDEKKLEVIGLKGALHGQCMDCHEKNGADNSCTACHARK